MVTAHCEKAKLLLKNHNQRSIEFYGVRRTNIGWEVLFSHVSLKFEHKRIGIIQIFWKDSKSEQQVIPFISQEIRLLLNMLSELRIGAGNIWPDFYCNLTHFTNFPQTAIFEESYNACFAHSESITAKLGPRWLETQGETLNVNYPPLWLTRTCHENISWKNLLNNFYEKDNIISNAYQILSRQWLKMSKIKESDKPKKDNITDNSIYNYIDSPDIGFFSNIETLSELDYIFKPSDNVTFNYMSNNFKKKNAGNSPNEKNQLFSKKNISWYLQKHRFFFVHYTNIRSIWCNSKVNIISNLKRKYKFSSTIKNQYSVYHLCKDKQNIYQLRCNIYLKTFSRNYNLYCEYVNFYYISPDELALILD